MFEDTGLYSQMRILVVSQKSCIFYVSYKYTDIQQYDAIEARIRTERIWPLPVFSPVVRHAKNTKHRAQTQAAKHKNTKHRAKSTSKTQKHVWFR